MDSRTIHVTERRRIPMDGLILGWGPVLPFPVAVVGVLVGWPALALLALHLAVLWGAAILCFLAGVRRGLSFRTEGGPRAVQIVTMIVLFLAGLLALVLPLHVAAGLLAAGYLALAVLDPVAARRGEVPLYFARLRPGQMGLAAVSLAVLALLPA